jgi:hypothetical protein
MRFATHDLKLTCEKPFRLPPYRYSAEKKKAIQQQVTEMLADGIIEATTSPYSSPIVMVAKKDGRYRFCVDYRRLNSITEDSAQPLPVIQEVLKDLGNATIFSTLDLCSGYWQIPLTERAKRYTAFVTPDCGQYAFRVTPFGLKGAGRTCTQLIGQEMLAGLMRECCMHYLDDVCFYSRSWPEHLVHLAKVFERLSTYGLTCAVEKCSFGKKKLEFLGHVIAVDQNEAKPEQVRAILEAPTPRSRKDLRGFFGVCGWLREYVPNFATVALPLTALLAKGPWKWTEATEKAFREVKALFAGPLTLYQPDPYRRLVLQTDACKTGMGAVLFQVGDREERRIICEIIREINREILARRATLQQQRAGVLGCSAGG